MMKGEKTGIKEFNFIEILVLYSLTGHCLEHHYYKNLITIFPRGNLIMRSDQITFTMPDDLKIIIYRWLPDSLSDIKAFVVISHGMVEHAGRYGRFAEALVNAGFGVYAHDQRGHGKTAGSTENVGYFADERGWGKVLDDLHAMTAIIKLNSDFPRVPVFLFGHSMGSFIVRHFVEILSSEVQGMILSGTSWGDGPQSRIGYLMARLQAWKKGRKVKSVLINKLAFSPLNKVFKPNRTEFDWLSRDNAEVDKYVNDPYCGCIPTAGFYCDFLEGIFFLNKAKNIGRIPKNFPVYLFSGTMDPVGNMTKGVLKVYNSLVKAGIKDVSYKFYNGGRHEMLNETNREEVYNDVIAWLNKHL